jgi:hypothetical protein
MTRPDTPIPLYPSEERIAIEVLGPDRVRGWPAIARHENTHGLPPVDTLMGGRHWESVVAFFRARQGLSLPAAVDAAPDVRTMGSRVRVVPFKPDGREDFDGEEARAAAGRRPAGRGHR